MKRLLTALSFSLVFVSCQQEIGFDSSTNQGGGGSTNGHLVKTVAITGTDTMTTVYTYDSQDRLETETTDGTSNSMAMTMHDYRKFERDAAGRMARIKQLLIQNGMASDTSINNIHYPNSSSMEMDYHVKNIGMMGMTNMDSTVYTYANGKMQNMVSWMSSPSLGMPAYQAMKNEFTYDAAGRVTLMKQWAVLGQPGDPLDHIADQNYTYTTSLNSGWQSSSPAQAFWTSGMPNATNDALATMNMQSLVPGAPSFNSTMTYVLGTGNKPVSATYTTTLGQVTKYTFYYQ